MKIKWLKLAISEHIGYVCICSMLYAYLSSRL